jgi:hypothetical protein
MASMAALARNTSSRSGSLSARRQKARTLSKEHRSSGHTSMTVAAVEAEAERDCSMSALAASPRSVLRQARMMRAAPRRAKWRAASRPSPPLAPETMTVRPAYEAVGTAMVRNWRERKCHARLSLLRSVGVHGW